MLLSSFSSGVRPFGVSLLVAGWDDDRPYLFQCDPSVRHIVCVASNLLYTDTLGLGTSIIGYLVTGVPLFEVIGCIAGNFVSAIGNIREQ